jgi:phosphoribosylamine---glycine ligase
MMENVLVIGNGGREHAIAWKLAQSPRIARLYVAPGNGGTGQIAENVPIDSMNIGELVEFAKTNQIDLTVVGPDEPLSVGVVDVFEANGLRIFGPRKMAAQIEASKAFSKHLMERAGIPTAQHCVEDDYTEAFEKMRYFDMPVVIKPSGLTKGKGVRICYCREDADKAIVEMLIDGRYGNAGKQIIIEEFIEGPEISIHALCDGVSSLMFPPAQDHKPISDGDLGDNTGGMGTIVPVPWVTPEMLRRIDETIVQPTLGTLRKEGRSFAGMLYPGLKMTHEGPKVLEFNARFGDPEAQSYMRLLKTDLLDVLDACVDGTLSNLQLEWHSGFAVCVVLVSGGYPGSYATGFPISGVAEAESRPGIVVFHAGTAFEAGPRTSGGRVLGVTAIGDTLKVALDRAYEAAQLIQFEGKYHRSDIGAKALALLP